MGSDNSKPVEDYEQRYQLNVDTLYNHIIDSTLTTEIVELLAKDTGIKIIDKIPSELCIVYLSPTLRNKYLYVKKSFKYTLPESMSDEIIITLFRQWNVDDVLKHGDNSWETYHLVYLNIMSNLVYFPDTVFTELFVNYVFEVINNMRYRSLKKIMSNDYNRQKDGIEHLVLSLKKKFVVKIPYDVMNKMLIKCIITENIHLRSSIKDDLLKLHEL
jgi:hypothetical protein